MTHRPGGAAHAAHGPTSPEQTEPTVTTPPATPPANIVEALRNSLLAGEQLRRTNQKLLGAAREPIAVVAMGCRLPGGVRSPEQLWQLVADGGEALGEFPTDRGWDLDGLLGADAELPRRAGFLEDAAGFDAGLFRISDREALAMDPQQRLLLETAWELAERAGIAPTSLRSTRTGTFVGVTHQAYLPPLDRHVPAADGYRLQGGLPSVASGRIAYTLGLNGPAVTVDTACSSSLSAVHLACQSLRADESSLAIAGGAMVMATPEVFVEFTRQGGLAADGRCKAFGDGADGTGFSEGVGLLLLERLSDALRAGHPVLAVIRGSALNQDGASNGLTAPSGPAQEQVIRQALANAGLTPSDVDLVEAHGTGTALGDPIEAHALINTYGKDRPQDRPLWLGSLKSNIGHTQTAAGVAGIIKTVMALRHGEMPRTLHADTRSSKVDWSRGSVRLLTEQRPWPDTGRPRRAAVSSFGVSGTNAHLVLEQAPPPTAPPRDPDRPSALTVPGFVWPVSAAAPGALRAQAAQLAQLLHDAPETDLAAVGHSLATTRAHLAHRAVLTGTDRDGLLDALDALADGSAGAGLVQGVCGPAGGTAFLFSGQGSQWPGMGRALHTHSPVFAQALDEVCSHLDPHLPRPLKDVMFAGPDTDEADLLDRTDFTQAALFALEVALYRTVEHLGPRPDFVAGHSVGEIAAAHVAGVLSLADAATLVAARGRLMVSLPATGAMIAVAASEKEVVATLRGHEDGVSVAAVNAPGATVISGDHDTVVRVAEEWRERGRRIQRLRVSHAFHSPHIDPVLDELTRVAAGLDLRPPAVPVVSTLTGAALSAAEACSPEYWARQARGAVRFADAVARLRDEGVTTFLEIGPDAVLTALGQSGPGASDAAGTSSTAWIATLRKKRDEPRVLTAALARLHVGGAPVDWTRLLARAARVELPIYPFQHRPYWLHTPPSRQMGTGGGLSPVTHPFLDTKAELADGEGWLFTGGMSVRTHPWLRDHAVGGTAVAAGAGTAELLLHAGSRLGCGRLDELTLYTPLVLPENASVDLQLRVRAATDDGRRPVELHFRIPSDDTDDTDDSYDTGAPNTETGWTHYAGGTLAPYEDTVPAWPDLTAWPPPGALPVDLDPLYERLAEQGVDFGPTFRLLTGAWRRGDDTYIEAHLPEDAADPGFAVHPALLDAGLQTCLVEAAADTTGGAPARMPFAIAGMRIFTPGATVVRAHLSTRTRATSPAAHSEHTLRLVDDTGRPVAVIDSLTLRPFTAETVGRAPSRRQAPYLLEWREVSPDAEQPSRDLCWILPEDGTARLPRDLGAGPHHIGIGPAVDALATRPHGDVAVLVCVGHPVTADAAVPDSAHRSARGLLGAVQEWLADERTRDRPLVVLTRSAVAAEAGEDVRDLALAPAWGLLRTAQSEHPGRFVLLDTDDHEASWQHLPTALATALADGEPQLALRQGRLLVPRLTRTATDTTLTVPDGPAAWRLTLREPATGSPDDLVLAACPEAEAPLTEGQVRVAVRAAGVSFRDVLLTLGMYPEPGRLGSELAAVVAECGPGVEGLRPGDRVLGLAWRGAMGPLAVTDHRNLVRVPHGWTYPQAATVPTAFLTAWQSLVDVADLRPGETVLVHAAAGGVGMAALQIARHLGADVYATAHPTKHATLRALGLDDSRIASSRDSDFEQRFRTMTAGRGIDVVLHSLSGEQTDASLRLLAPGGRLVDIGRTDPRDPRRTALDHPGTRYLPYGLDTRPDRVARTFARLGELFGDGTLQPLPVTALDVRDAPRAIRLMRDAAHTGKIVLTVPRPLDPHGTVLVTGGTGTLGSLAARHLVTRHHVRHLLLVGRRGPDAPGAESLRAELTGLGAHVTLAACDVADPDALAALLDTVPADHPLTAVVHAAGTVDPGAVSELTPEQMDGVLGPKADAAWHLHRLTEHLDLAEFVLYSSAAGVLGLAGQGNYAAAHTLVDALAHHRRRQGLPATALVWGMWEERSAMGEELGAEGIRQLLGSGIVPMSAAEGLARLDAALGTGPDSHHPLLIPARLDLNSLRAQPSAPLLSGLAPAPARPSATAGVADRFAALPEPERRRFLLDLVTRHTGAVLSHPDPTAIPADTAFRDLGFDSVTAVEARNRLAASTALPLSATVVFDHPSPAALAAHLHDRLADATASRAAESSATESSAAGAPPAAHHDGTAAGLGALLRQAVSLGRTHDGIGILTAAARLRPTFSRPPKPENTPAATWLRRAGGPALICVEPFIPGAANLTYQRLAGALDGRYDVAAVPLPGYRDGERLPASVDAVAEALAAAVENCAEGEPFTLVGFSTGGFAAHATARCLEAGGIRPEAVVLLDSLSPGAIPEAASADILQEWLASQGEFWTHDDTGLTALGWYLDLFGRGWRPTGLTAPVLLVEAAEQVPSAPEQGWAGDWPDLTARTTTPGSHFTLLTEYVTRTADTLTGLLDLHTTADAIG
ncbi:type I polyketide synthase [Streptomyces scabiei]|uniref:type I polyketide synthase n=1 Tax=Streptomyces scabiei TaxID=1930 RepID=UPI000765C0CE|nr:type I polyketide synthase [Streptomyces scabiei]